MPRSLEHIAREAAMQIVREAERYGYGITAGRAVFAVSDQMKLEDEILAWLQDHMDALPANAD